jgi:hypothetical protein
MFKGHELPDEQSRLSSPSSGDMNYYCPRSNATKKMINGHVFVDKVLLRVAGPLNVSKEEFLLRYWHDFLT